MPPSPTNRPRKSGKSPMASRLRTAVGGSFVATLRKSGGALIVTVPKDYIRDNALAEGAQLNMKIKGSKMVLEPAAPPRRRRPSLAELLANTPEFQRVPGWDEAPAVGLEVAP
jgi:antitoxin ChpS